mgnify:CR=1 FL=1
MSRIAKQPIALASNITADVQGHSVKVKGPKGEMTLELHPTVGVELNDNELTMNPESDSAWAMAGTMRALLANIVEGVTNGFSKKLQLVGVGYRASNQGQKLDLALGFSHNIVFDLAPEVKVETISEKGKNPIVKLTSHDKQLVGHIAAKIRSFRRPEPYKGKGVKFVGEILRRKAGKSA